MRQLHQKYAAKGEVVFLSVEQKEPHAGRMAFEDIEQPATFEERRALAIRSRDEFQLPFLVLIDGMDDESRAVFTDLPSPAFIIDRAGVIRDKLPWADPELIEKSLLELATAEAASAETRRSTTLESGLVSLCIALARGDAAAAAAAIEQALREAKFFDWRVVAQIRLALARAHQHDQPAAGLTARRLAAEVAAKTWEAYPARLVAAYVELAECAGPAPDARDWYAAALKVLEPRAPALQRTWLETHLRATAKPESR